MGFEGQEGIDFFVEDIVNGDSDISFEGIGFLKAVAAVEEDGIFFEGWCIGAEEGDGDHVGGILDEDAGVTVVGMIVPWSVCDDNIGVPGADEASDESSIFECGFEFAVMDIEDFVFDAKFACDCGGFGGASFGEWSAGHIPVADIAIGDGDHFDFVSQCGPESSGAATLVFGVIRVSPEADDAEALCGGGFLC